MDYFVDAAGDRWNLNLDERFANISVASTMFPGTGPGISFKRREFLFPATGADECPPVAGCPTVPVEPCPTSWNFTYQLDTKDASAPWVHFWFRDVAPVD